MSISKIGEKKFWINKYGLLLFRNKHNKDLVLKRPYYECANNFLVIDKGRQNLIVETPKLHEIDFKDWIPITKEEYIKENMTNEQIKQERDEAMDILSQISFEFGFGLGDETTSAQEYYERIKEGFKFLTNPIIDLKNKYKEERDEAILGLLKSEETITMKLSRYDCIISKLDNARKEADFYKAKYEALLQETQNER